jgi:hypothetical protein
LVFVRDFFLAWWDSVFARGFAEKPVFGVAFLWSDRGDLRGWRGVLTASFPATKITPTFSDYFPMPFFTRRLI